MSQTPSLLDSIRRTIEERNLFSARSRVNFVSALRSADHGSRGVSDKGSRNFSSPLSSRGTALIRMGRLRNKVIQEIIKTEEIYVNQLKTIQNEFMEDPDIRLTFSKREYNGKGKHDTKLCK